MKRKRQFPGATPYTDRHGRRRWRYRARGRSWELGTAYGSPEFVRRYEAAVAQARETGGAGSDRAPPRSLSALIASWYRSPEFRALAPATARTYRAQVERLREAHGMKPVAGLERRHVAAILAKKADTPSAANNLRKRLIQLLDHAVSLDWIAVNPAKATKPYRTSSDGFHTWDEGEISRFFEVHPPGTLAHRAVSLMIYTGAARVDVVALGWQNVKGGRIAYRRRKTGELATMPLHPDLAAVLADCPRDAMTFLETAQGASRSPAGLGNLMREWCDAANLGACSAHGLRKACARRLAEAGATAHEIGAVTGHKTLAEVQRYTAAAGREGMADAAFEKLLARPNGEQTVVNLEGRFAKSQRNHMKGKEK